MPPGASSESPALLESRPGLSASWAALLLFALLELLVWERVQPPPARPLDAPPGEFSAARAGQTLERLLDEGLPHPTGSAAQARVRARLVEALKELGLEPQIQSGVACGPEGVCAELHNVLAELPGSQRPSQTLLAAHYDSVPAGPGAGDDGQGVATLLEVARALRATPAQSGTWLLFTDGEELGLLGARLFTRDHPLLAQLRVAVNLEARGNRGASLMFETGAHSGWLVRSYAQSPHPIATSLFGPVYQSLPNDTDFSVFVEHGLEGLNFAFVGGVAHYHTPYDTLDHLDLRSLQQQGDAALTTLRGLSSPSVQTGAAELAFFDVLGLWLVTLPAAWLLPAALLGLACWAVTVGRELRRRPRDARPLGRAAVALLLAWGLPALLVGSIGTLLELLGALPFPVIATPQPFLLAILLWVVGGQALACWLTPTPAQRRALADITWLCWLAFGLALALALPAASYLLVLPGLAAALIRLGSSFAPAHIGSEVWSIASALFSGLLTLPLLSLLPSTLELSAPVVLALALGLALSPLTPLLGPLLARPRVRLGLMGGGLALALSQLAWPAYSADVPQRLSLVLEADASAEAHWLADGNAGELPAGLRQAARFAPRPSRPHPWPGFASGLMYVASAPAAVLPPPSPRILRQGRRLRLELDAPPDLWALGLRYLGPERILAARWQGQAIQTVSDAAGQRVLLVLGDQRALAVEFEFEHEPSELPQVLALALGLPGAGAPLQLARGAKAVASGFGDMTVIHLEARLE